MPDFSRWGETDIEEMETVRRLTAQSTAASWTTIPHVTQFDEADITGLMGFIEKNAPKVEKAGAKLTVTAIITRVCAEALKRFPRFNASIDVANRRIILKRYVHIGIAADTPRGLLVPVIRDADQRSIVDLAKAIGDLAQRARNKKIKPDELEGGTFSISNQGGIGGVGFTPIVLWPQVAILGVSRSTVKPVFVQDRFEPRTILPLSLSYDHRIIDGADAARFLRWICDGLEQPMTLFLD
jgi:pyruvate dehydrogenase E2 component (dihydrolipoamide acetyltransferase)